MTTPPTATDDVWTVQRILQWTTQFLQGKGIESARLEAELLLAHARSCQRIHLYTCLDEPLTENQRAAMRGFVKRRANREPLAYITGVREFYGREFAVGSGLLVPRPETETLIDTCLDLIPSDCHKHLLEVGFGTGCISITLAKQRPGLNVIAGDISDDALPYARKNAERHDVADRIDWQIADGLSGLKLPGELEIAGVVSNPPYIRNDELEGLEPEVRIHEAQSALVSGDDGLDLIRRLISEAVPLLEPSAWMVLECDPGQCAAIGHLFEEAGFQSSQVHKDLNGSDRIVSAIR